MNIRYINPYVFHLFSRTLKKNPPTTRDFPLLIATQKKKNCFVILAGAKIETSLPLVPLQNAVPHGQSKQNLKPL